MKSLHCKKSSYLLEIVGQQQHGTGVHTRFSTKPTSHMYTELTVQNFSGIYFLNSQHPLTKEKYRYGFPD